jgi:hypothetical protein
MPTEIIIDSFYSPAVIIDANVSDIVVIIDLPGSGVGGSSTPTGSIVFVLIQASRAALASDAGKLIQLDGSLNPVDYTIDPVAMTGKEFKTICIDATNRVRTLPASGNINGNTEVEYGTYDSAFIAANGTNLLLYK